MSELAKCEENGKKGESRTESILLDQFWVLKRSVDVDGADFLVQLRSKSLEELWKKNETLQVLGIVQAKFFEGTNQVSIQREYVQLKDGKPRAEFFAMLHTDNDEGEAVCFFFSAAEIIEQFFLNKAGTHYCFSLKSDRSYDQNKDLKRRDVALKIKVALESAEIKRQDDFVASRFFGTPSIGFSSE